MFKDVAEDEQALQKLLAVTQQATAMLEMLEGCRVDRTQWFEFLPTENLLFEGAKAEPRKTTLLVDVAGGQPWV